MSDTDHDPTDDTDHSSADGPETSISEKTDRLETIVEQLEDGEVSLERANELHAEGQALLEALRDDLELDDGAVTVHD